METYSSCETIFYVGGRLRASIKCRDWLSTRQMLEFSSGLYGDVGVWVAMIHTPGSNSTALGRGLADLERRKSSVYKKRKFVPHYILYNQQSALKNPIAS